MVAFLTGWAALIAAPPALAAAPLAAAPTTTPNTGTAPAGSSLGAGVPGGPPGLLGAPTTTVARPRKTTTTPPPSTRPRQGLATPESAARNLWDGWRDDDRARARLFASRAA